MIIITLSGFILLYSTIKKAPESVTRNLFIIMVSSSLIWCIGYTISISVTELELKKIFTLVEYVGITTVAPLFFIFVLSFTRNMTIREKPIILIVFIPSLIHYLILLTNDINGGLFYASVLLETSPPFNRLNLTYGPMFYSHTFYNYMLILLGLIFLIQRYNTSMKGDIYRKQILIIIVGISLPLFMNLIRVYKPFKALQFIDLTPASFLLTFMICYYSLYKYGFLIFIPIAIERIFDELTDGIVVLDRDFKIMNINNTYLDFFSISNENKSMIYDGDFFSGMKKVSQHNDFILELGDFQKQLNELKNDPHKNLKCNIELVRQGQESQKYFFNFTVTTVLQNQTDIIGYILIVRNITDRIHTEEEMIKLKRSIEQSASSVTITDLKGNIEYVNPIFYKLTGFTEEEILGKNPRILKSGITPDLEYKNLWETISEGKEWQGEFSNKKKNGEIYLETARISPVKNTKGEIINYIKVAENITEKKKAEENIDFLHSLLRHDVGNKMEIIFGFLSFVNLSNVSDEERRNITGALKGTHEAIALIHKIDKLYVLERTEIIQSQSLDVTIIINQIIKSYTEHAEILGFKIEFINEGTEFLVLGGEFLNELFSNLIENSLNHSGGKLLRISIKEDENYIKVFIEDDGVGISPDKLQKIFNKGTKGTKSKGSGIGLFLTKNIAKIYGGDISADSSELGGAQFIIKLNKVKS